MDSDLDSLLNSITYKSKDKTKHVIIPEAEPGQNSKELNPYWKNGGSGLPMPNDSNRKQASTAGDGGLSWWRKALQRCKETASDEGKSLEEVAAERYGSLSFLHNKIKEAELYVASTGRSSSDNRRSRESFKGKSLTKPNDSLDSDYFSGRKREHDRRKDIDDRKKDIDDREKDRDERRRDIDDRRNDKRYSQRDRFYQENCKRRNDDPQEVKSFPPSTSSNFEAKPRNTDKEIRSEQNIQEPPKQLSAEEKNKLSAKLLRAEMMGDKDLVEQLKAAIEGSAHPNPGGNEKKKAISREDEEDEQEEILVLQNQRGGVVPFQDKRTTFEPQGRNKRQKLETHRDGQRLRYFHDDDQKSLEALVREEKLGRGSDDIDAINRMAGRAARPLYEDETIDDEMLRNETTNKPAKTFSKQKQLAIIEQKKMSSKIGDCTFCFKNIQKHLVVSMGTKALLCMPRNKSMVEGHCLIVTLQHVVQSTACDEDVLEEINTYKKSLVRMFEANDEDVVFMETCKNLKSYPHLVIECVPVPREIGEVAPICFQKAIDECGPEWSNNKKLVTIRGGVKRSIPAGFPYFHVGFGTDDGYGHVIEDEESFPWYFGREVLGGLLDLESTLWRKPRFDDFEEQRRKTVEFTKTFKAFDPFC